MFSLADTHCHLDFKDFQPDLAGVLNRAAEAGIEKILDPGLDLETSQEAVRLAGEHPQVFAAVGIHPNDSAGWQSGWVDQLRGLAGNPRVVAIGEIGLDYYRNRSPRDLQQAAFRAQLGLAGELGLPVIIHTRQSLEDALQIVNEWTTSLRTGSSPLADRPGVFHAFEGGLAEARQASAMNFMIGIGGPVSFRNADQKREVASTLPLERIVFETDAPFLAPHPHRGQRNEPAYIRLIAEVVASLRGQSLSSVAEITSENANRLFAWSR